MDTAVTCREKIDSRQEFKFCSVKQTVKSKAAKTTLTMKITNTTSAAQHELPAEGRTRLE